MSMTTRGSVPAGAEKRDIGPGGAIVDTCSDGRPSVADGASTQSPASLKQPKGPTTVATFSE